MLRNDDPYKPMKDPYSLDRWQRIEEQREQRESAREARDILVWGDVEKERLP